MRKIDTSMVEISAQSNTSYYWSVYEAYSHQDCFIFMILGNRGCGKTYSTKAHVIRRFIEHGEQFAYVRRTESDIDRTNFKFFNDMYELFPDHELKVVGGVYICDGEIMGFSYALSTSLAMKGSPTPQVMWIIFDEFLIDPKAPYQRYLKEEVYLFLQLYETIARPIEGKKEVPVFLLANVYSSINPWFIEFDVRVPNNKKGVYKNKRGVYLQIIDNPEFKNAKRNTAFGRLVEGTTYEKTSINNEFIRDDAQFIIAPPQKQKYMFTLKCGGLQYGVTLIQDNSMFYVSETYDRNNAHVVTTLLDDMSLNTTLLKGSVKNIFFEDLKRAFNQGKVRYDGLLAQQAVTQSIYKSL